MSLDSGPRQKVQRWLSIWTSKGRGNGISDRLKLLWIGDQRGRARNAKSELVAARQSPFFSLLRRS